MQFDDRLATVLRMQAGNERASNTQFRQLLDLAGSAPEGADDAQLEAAYARLGELSAAIPADQRAAMIREPGVRLRNPGFIAFLATQERPVASAAMTAARLKDAQWQALVPALPLPVRALLRERRNLPQGTRDMLARLGVRDLVLPDPGLADAPISAGPTGTIEQAPPIIVEPLDESVLDLDPALEIEKDGEQERAEIGALVRRIEAFQRARERKPPLRGPDAPRLPLGEYEEAPPPLAAFDFTTDVEGRIAWADSMAAPMAVGLALANAEDEAPASPDEAMLAAMRRRQPIRSARLVVAGAPAIAGEWRVDAAPHFASGGRFAGYRGRMRRPAAHVPKSPLAAAHAVDSPADRMRQVIHELRTPVNAIQGFAEIIQQQLFGPTPNEYRALAASIAGDAARMLAGFEELDRLMKLESGALEMEAGSSDFQAIVAGTVEQLDGVLRARNAGLELVTSAATCPIPLSRDDAEMLAWRILATIAGAVNPGERLQIVLIQNGRHAALEIDLPAALADRHDIFESTTPAQAQAVSAGMFGNGFTLRLARAEARAAGGDLRREDDALELVLPIALSTQSGTRGNEEASGDQMAEIA